MNWVRKVVVEGFLRVMEMPDNLDPKPPQAPHTAVDPATESAGKAPNRPFPRLRTIVFRAVGAGSSDCKRDVEQTGYQLSDRWKLFTPTALYLRFVGAKLREWKYLNDGRRLVLLSFQAEEGDLSEVPDRQSQMMFKEVDGLTMDRLKGVAHTVAFGKATVWNK